MRLLITGFLFGRGLDHLRFQLNAQKSKSQISTAVIFKFRNQFLLDLLPKEKETTKKKTTTGVPTTNLNIADQLTYKKEIK